MTTDHIALKYTTDPPSVVESNISAGQPDACDPGELVLSAQSGSAKIITIDATGAGVQVRGVLSNQSKGSVTVSSFGEGPSSILLNANSVTADKVASNSVTSDKIASPVLITKGGTGQATANAALNALLPAQAGNQNELLTTDGSNTSWIRASLNIDQLNDVDTSSAAKLDGQLLKWDQPSLQWKQRENITTFADELPTNTQPGRQGQIGVGEDYFYVCHGPEKWSRTPLQSWNDGAILRSPTASGIAFTYEPTIIKADPYYSNVSLLLHMDGANLSTSFVDSSPSPLTVGRSGNTSIRTTPSQFGGGSGYFDGTGDYLTFAYYSSLDLIGSNFTIEAWLYPLTYKASGMRIISAASYTVSWNNNNGIHWLMQLDSIGRLVFQYWTGTAAAGWATTAVVPLSSWSHVAASFNGSTLFLAVNGAVQSFAVASISRPLANPQVEIASITSESGNSSVAYNGYMEEVRITKGVARYTSNFNVPTIAFPELGYTPDPYFANVSLLLHADANNGDTFIKDYSPNALNVTFVPGASISTAQSKFGGSSISLPTTASFVTVSAINNEFSFGAGNFTIEFWAYFTHSADRYARWITFSGTTGGYGELTIRQEINNQYSFFFYINGVVNGPYLGGTVIRNAWTHIAFVRSGNTWQMHANGTVVNGRVLGAVTLPSFSQVTLGGFSGEHGTGFYDEVRITKGVARYTTNFTAPTAPYPNLS